MDEKYEEVLLEKMIFVLSVNNKAQAIRMLEQYKFDSIEEYKKIIFKKEVESFGGSIFSYICTMINKKLIKIDVDGEILYYKVDSEVGHGDYAWSWTKFYKTNDKFKTISLFGYSIFRYHANIMEFQLDYDIEDLTLTKEKVKKDIIRRMTRDLRRKKGVTKLKMVV